MTYATPYLLVNYWWPLQLSWGGQAIGAAKPQCSTDMIGCALVQTAMLLSSVFPTRGNPICVCAADGNLEGFACTVGCPI